MDPNQDRMLPPFGDRDPIDVLRGTPLRLEDLARPVARDADVHPDGPSSSRLVVCRMADRELAFGFGARQVVAGVRTPHVAQAYDADAWARDYGRMDPALAIEAFRALRSWNLAWLARLELHDWLRTYLDPERGVEETVDDLVRDLAAHDLARLAQLERISGP